MKKKILSVLLIAVICISTLCACGNSATDTKATIVNNEGATEELSSKELYAINEENSAKFEKTYLNAQVTITGTVESVDSYRHSFFPCDMYQINLKEGWKIEVVADFHEEVIDFVCEGVKEILPYNVDGIHFDDYFYPTTDSAIDCNEYINSGYDNLQQFRLDNVSKLISSVYSTIKSYDSNILFGVSPQGNIDNNYNSQYADVNRWCREDGFIDYIAPQIYYGFNNQTAPFSETVNKWEDIITNSKIKLIGGLAGYKIGRVDTYAGSNGQNEWIEENDILKRQVEVLSKTQNYGGIIIYRYSSLFSDDSDKIKKEVEALMPLLIN